MTGGRVRLVTLAALIATLSGCGQGGGHRPPDVARLPLVGGARVVAQTKRCDRGANAYCAVELVVIARRYPTSADLVKGEGLYLGKLGWTSANGDIGEEKAAESPGHQLRLTYATAYGDLKGIDLGWIKRPRPIALALADTLFARASAMSLMLEAGPS